ncbi:MAG: radical SAM protein [Candidatus Aquicultorales bacterium]
MRKSKYLAIHEITRSHFLLVNALTGALDLVDGEIAKALDSDGSAGSLDPALVQRLAARGHLVSGAEEEAALVHRMFDLYKPSRKMIRFTVSPTYACNLRCAYCFESGRVYKRSPSLAAHDVGLIFDAVAELASAEPDLPKSVNLFGGEPLLPGNRQAVESIIERTRELSLPMMIVTNGVFVRDYADLLKSFPEKLNVQVTLDGPERIHDKRRIGPRGAGTYGAIVEAVDLLLDWGVGVTVRVNVDGENLPYLKETAELVIAKGWTQNDRFIANLAPVMDHTGAGAYPHLLEEPDLLGPLLDLIEGDDPSSKVFKLGMFRSVAHLKNVIKTGKSAPPQLYYCEANNRESFEFGPDGFIYACSECMNDPSNAIGAFRPRFELFEEKVKEWGERNVSSIPKCRSCELAFFCGGGCAYAALARNGSLYEPHCGSIRKLIDVFLERTGRHLIDKVTSERMVVRKGPHCGGPFPL